MVLNSTFTDQTTERRLFVVGNFYAPIRTLLEGATEAGFIQSQNLSLVTILDVESEGEGEEWGTKVVKALEDWTPPVSHILASRR